MANLGISQSRALDSLPDTVDVAGDDLGRRAHVGASGDALRRAAVQVLAADGDAVDGVGQLGAVLRDGGLEGEDLVGKGSLAARSPQAEEQGGSRVQGGGDS